MKRILPVVLFFLLLLSVSALASSVGIIGGADGPTAILITGESLFSRIFAAVLRFFLRLLGRV